MWATRASSLWLDSPLAAPEMLVNFLKMPALQHLQPPNYFTIAISRKIFVTCRSSPSSLCEAHICSTKTFAKVRKTHPHSCQCIMCLWTGKQPYFISHLVPSPLSGVTSGRSATQTNATHLTGFISGAYEIRHIFPLLMCSCHFDAYSARVSTLAPLLKTGCGLKMAYECAITVNKNAVCQGSLVIRKSILQREGQRFKPVSCRGALGTKTSRACRSW